MNTARCPLQSGDEGAILLSYLDRQLDSDSTAALDRHVTVCADCRRVVDAQRAVWSALDQWEPVAVSEDFDSRVMARIAVEEAPWWRRILAPADGWWRPAIPVTAACAAVLAVAIWRGPTMSDHPQQQSTMDSTEAQQVEDALTDLDMLRQLGMTEAKSLQ
jgi:hypothetical protein